MIFGGIRKRDMLCDLLKDISVLMNADCMYSVTDTEKFIAYMPGRNVDIKVRIGMPVPPQSPLTEAARQARQVTSVMPKEVWGVPFRSTATPIFDENNKVVGCIGIGMSIEREDALVKTHHNFVEQFGSITSLNTSLMGGMHKMEADSRFFYTTVSDASKLIKKVDGFIASINTLTQTTNLLSINAAIEAARAGQSGKGFALVASEMKSFSAKTKELAGNISSLLEQISEVYDKLSEIAQENAEEVAAQIRELDNVKMQISQMKATSEDYSKLLML